MGMSLKVVLQAVGDHLGLRQNADRGRQVLLEQMLDKGEVRAAQDHAMWLHAVRLRAQARDCLGDESVDEIITLSNLDESLGTLLRRTQ